MGVFCGNLVAGVISGFVASVVFLLFMLIIRPKIVLSDSITVDKNGIYKIKIVNKSFCRLSELKYDLRLCDDHGDGIVDIETIQPLKPRLDSIPKYSKKDKNSMYAIRISYKSKDNNCIINNNNSYLEFVVSAKHTLSNTYSVVSKNYRCNDIKFGIFETGKNINVLKDTSQRCDSPSSILCCCTTDSHSN